MAVPIGEYKQAVEALAQRMKAFYDKALIDIEKEWKKNYISGSKFANEVEVLAQETNQEIDDKFIERFCHKAVMTLMLRFLFLRFAEDKKILEPFFRKETIEKWQKENKEVQEVIREAFEKAREKFRGLYKITVYDEFLPSKESLETYLIDTLSNEPSSGLYKDKGSLDFATLDPTVVSAFYERLFDRKKRKELGLFFTPPVIADYLVEKAFEGQKITKEFLVLDPACGSGQILLAAYKKLKNIFVNQLDMSPSEAHKRILSYNLWGVDVEPFAVLLSKINLAIQDLENIPEYINIIHGDSLLETGFDIPQMAMLKDVGEKQKQKLIKETIKLLGGKEITVWRNGSGRILLEKPIKQEALFELAERMKTGIFFEETDIRTMKDLPKEFDVVVANPPYGAEIDKNLVEGKFFITSPSSSTRGMRNSYNTEALFLEKGLQFLKTKGKLCFIVPNNIARGWSFAKVRYLILNKFHLKLIVDEGNPFPETVLEMITLLIEKDKTRPDSLIQILSRRKGTLKKINQVKQLIFRKFDRFIIYYDKLFEKILSRGKTNIITTSGNLVIGSKFLKAKRLHNDDVPVITGRSTGRYYIKKENLEYVNLDYLRTLKRHFSFLDKELLVQTLHINYFEATIKPKDYTLGESSVIIHFDDKKFDQRYIMAILNSKLFKIITARYIFNNSHLTFDLTSPATKLCPITLIPLESQKPFIREVDKILELNKKLQETEKSFYKFVEEKIENKISLREIEGLDFVNIKDSQAKLGDGGKISVEQKANNAIVAINKKPTVKIICQDGVSADFLAEYLDGLHTDILSGEDGDSWIERILNTKIHWDKKSNLEKILNEYKTLLFSAGQLKKEIAETDKKIDEMIYDLYEITKEERKIIEEPSR